MAALELALVLLAVVLVSAVLDQVIPRVSLPLIQIACGVVVALFARGQISITLNPELFLVLFIAPLLFHEAQVADKTGFPKNQLYAAVNQLLNRRDAAFDDIPFLAVDYFGAPGVANVAADNPVH